MSVVTLNGSQIMWSKQMFKPNWRYEIKNRQFYFLLTIYLKTYKQNLIHNQ
jgi:hypothetical protein